MTATVQQLLISFVLSAVGLVSSMTYEGCISAGHNTHCEDVDKVTPRIYCLSTGQKTNGTCAFIKEVCRQTYLLNKTVTITGYGQACTNPHITLHTTTHAPTSVQEQNLFSAIAHGIDDRLQSVHDRGINASESIKIFSKQDHIHKTYVRNTKCWAYGIDLTSISPWNSAGHTRKAGTLISPRHAVWARHYSMRPNTTLRFVDNQNNIVERKIIRTKVLPTDPHHSSGRSYLSGYDMVIGLLDRDVPASINFAKVLPRNLTTLIPHGQQLPVLSTDYEEKALVDDLLRMSSTMVNLRPPASSLRHPYYESKIVGDSGNPSFFVIDNEIVFLFVFTYGGAGAGTSVQYHHDHINAIMKQLGGGYQLTEKNLSKYITKEQITNIFG